MVEQCRKALHKILASFHALEFADGQELNALEEESRQERAIPESAAEGPLWPVDSEAKGWDTVCKCSSPHSEKHSLRLLGKV